MIDRIRDVPPSGMGGQAEQIKEKALDAAAAARERLARGTDYLRGVIVEHPARALGVALGMGVILGWLIKRR